MFRKLILIISVVFISAAPVMAEKAAPEQPVQTDAKMLGGMSVLGNQEAPMSLFIVPWKSSELGGETNLTRTLNERDQPVDRDVFMREMEFHQVSAASPSIAAELSHVVVAAK
jgi:hypothetical protein